jgi:hypothetical protein
VQTAWRGPAGVRGSPVLGGGAVRVARQLPHFVSPSLSGGLVLIGTMTGVTAISGG